MMSKRLQVLLDEREHRAIQRLAKRRGMTTAAWVRELLRTARESEGARDPRATLLAIRAAVRHEYPTADITTMLGEIERGRAPGVAGGDRESDAHATQ